MPGPDIQLQLMRAYVMVVAMIIAGCGEPGRAPNRPATGAEAAPPARGPLVAARAMTEDLEHLRTIYDALHPGLDRYTTPGERAAAFAAARSTLSVDRSLGELYVAITKLTALVRCGHSYPNFGNQPEAIRKALFEGPRLPFTFRWLGDEMVVVESLTTDRSPLAPGTIVERINGIATRDLLSALIPLARADGHNDDKRRAYLEVHAIETYEAFELLAPLVFPALWDVDPARPLPSLQVAVRTWDGKRSDRTIAMMSSADRERIVKARGGTPSASDPLWKLEVREHAGRRIGYLAMPTWVAYKTKWDWQGFMHDTMRKVTQEQLPLIVDLRGNEGGNDVGDLIVAHLIDRPLVPRTNARKVRFASVPQPLRTMLDTWDDSFFELGAEATEVAGGWRELDTRDDAIQPVAPLYRGKLIVLIDASNSSAAFQFAATIKQYRLGVLVGAPTGGNQRGINGGAFFFARLPNTKLEVDVPLIGTFPRADKVPDAGITPDIEVRWTAADLAAGRDPQLARALALAVAATN